MSDNHFLDRLAEAAGIYRQIEDHKTGVWFDTPPDTKRTILSAMGYPAWDEEKARASLHRFEEREWRRMAPPVTVVREDRLPIKIELVLPSGLDSQKIIWKLKLENGEICDGSVKFEDMPYIDAREIESFWVHRRRFTLPINVPLGYHELSFSLAGGGFGSGNTRLIVAPKRCYMPPALDKDRVWGFPVQLYALRSERNWGIGDFSDLMEIVRISKKLGAEIVGVNPLNTLFAAEPESASPYCSCSRLFVNHLYIVVESAHFYNDAAEVQDLVSSKEFEQ